MKTTISLPPSSLIHSHTIYKLAKHVTAEKMRNPSPTICVLRRRQASDLLEKDDILKDLREFHNQSMVKIDLKPLN